MPLRESSSKKAFSHNVAEMMKSGHPQKQAVAAAYSEQREAKKHHMAEGGEIEMDEDNEALMDHCAMECLNAMETKDKAAFKEAFHVLVADILNKFSMEMEPQKDEMI